MENWTANGLVIASFVCRIAGLFCGFILGVWGIILGTMKENERGDGLAEDGRIIGWVEVGVFMYAVEMMFIGLVIGFVVSM